MSENAPSPADAPARPRRERSPRIPIFLTIFIDLLGFGIVIPILTFISEDYLPDGASKGLYIATTMSAYSIMQMIFAPVLGRLSDRVGRRPVLLLSLCGSTLSYFLFAMSHSFAMILLARTIGGICAANISTAQAYMADVSDAKDRTKSMGLIGAAFGLGFAFGPVLGGGAAWLGSEFWADLPAQRAPGLLAAGICFVNLIWAWARLPESLPPEKRSGAAGGTSEEAWRRTAPLSRVFASLKHPIVGPLIGIFFFATIGFANLEMAIGLFAKKSSSLMLSERGIYGVFMYVGLVLLIVHGYVVRKAVKVIPEASLVVIGTAIQVVGLVLIPLIPGLAGVLVGMGVVSVGQGLCVPCLLALVSLATSESRQGEVLGVTQSASSLARILGPAIAGVTMAVGHLGGKAEESYGLPFYSGAALMALAVWMALITRRRLIARPFEEDPAFAPEGPAKG